MEKQKRNIELIANDTNGALELKKLLVQKGMIVNHIYTGSSTPILIDNGYYLVGAGNIRRNYGLFNKNN
jgi:hypothetical protein